MTAMATVPRRAPSGDLRRPLENGHDQPPLHQHLGAPACLRHPSNGPPTRPRAAREIPHPCSSLAKSPGAGLFNQRISAGRASLAALIRHRRRENAISLGGPGSMVRVRDQSSSCWTSDDSSDFRAFINKVLPLTSA